MKGVIEFECVFFPQRQLLADFLFLEVCKMTVGFIYIF